MPKTKNIFGCIQDIGINNLFHYENLIISDNENGSAIPATIYSSSNHLPETVIMFPNSEHDLRMNIETLITQKIIDLDNFKNKVLKLSYGKKRHYLIRII